MKKCGTTTIFYALHVSCRTSIRCNNHMKRPLISSSVDNAVGMSMTALRGELDIVVIDTMSKHWHAFVISFTGVSLLENAQV